MTEDVSLEMIARQTVGMSGSSINTLFNEASIRAVMADRSVITREDIDMALTQMITNGEISKTVDKDELEMVAYHEAGHALLSRLVAHDPVQKVTIIGNTAGALGITIHGGNEQNLLRLCDMHSVPISTNIATAEVLLRGLDQGDLDYREGIHPDITEPLPVHRAVC